MNIKLYSSAALSAVILFFITCVFTCPIISFIALIPFLYSLSRSTGLFSYIKISSLFFAIYYFLSFSFLLKLSELIYLPEVIGTIVSFLATAITALLTAAIHMLPTIVMYRFSKHRIFDAICYAAMFTLGEFFVGLMLPVGVPIVTVSLSLVGLTPFLQSASLLGSLFLTLITVIINALFVSILSSRLISMKSLTSAVLIILIFLFNTIFGVIRINSYKSFGESLNVSVAQINKSGLAKWSHQSSSPLSDYKTLIEGIKNADMIFLPETAITYSLGDSQVTGDINEALKSTGAEIVSGIFYHEDNRSYNAYCSFTDDKTAVYLKRILVPFGEFSLFGDKLFDGTDSLSSAQSISPLYAENATIAAAICIESIYPKVIRKQVKQGGEIIAVPTNDSWFPGTHLQRLHLKHSVLRSVENSRYLVRSANSGISAVISPFGEKLAEIPEGQSGVISAQILKLNRKTPYTVLGNTWILILVALFLYIAFFNLKQTGRIRLFKLDF